MKVAVIGQGSAGKRQAQILLDLGVHVVACDPRVPALKGTEPCDDFSEAIDGVDAAVIASSSYLHAGHVKVVVERGIPALVEKPLALTASSAWPLASLAQRRGVPLVVGMNLRFHPAVERLKQRLSSIGPVWYASAWCGSWLPGWQSGDYRVRYSARAAEGGGVLLDVAVHELDYLLWLLGPVASVSASLSKVSTLQVDVEDVAVLTMVLESGAVLNLGVDYLDRDRGRGYRVVGAEGTVSSELGFAPEAYRIQMRRFLLAVAHGADDRLATAEEAARILEVVDAARVSAREHRTVLLGAADSEALVAEAGQTRKRRREQAVARSQQ